MAANNYFGFTHGGTQYAATGTPAYQAAPQAGYAVAQTAAAAAAATYTTQRAATGYDTYQPAAHTTPGTYAVAAGTTAPTTYDGYGYARTAPTAYDTTKTYYQQAAPATQAYSTADYQGKTAYSATYTTQSVRPATQQKAATYNAAGYTGPQAQQATFTYPTTQAAATFSAAATSYANGASATSNYATTYPTQTQSNVQAGKANTTWQGYKKAAGMRQMRPKPTPKPQQLIYCEVCKISCAGRQTYGEHLEGQRHKKKEALQKEGGATVSVSSRGGNNLRCELCDVVCTGTDAYAAHLRGAKHQKVVKLHTRLGKPIPDVNVKAAKAAATTGITSNVTISAAPKINFVPGGNLGTVKTTETKEEVKEDIVTSNDIEMSSENEVTPVGQEYIEEIKSDEGKLISFNCKLCECKFNDPNAKDMHMKGRRHRLQFKKKVNPDLVVDVKPSGRRGRIQEEKNKRREEYMRRREDERSFWADRLVNDERIYWEERRRYEEEYEFVEWMRRRGPGPFIPPQPFGIRRFDTLDDRHFIIKHQSIHPKEIKMQLINKMVNQIEKSLKIVSDQIAEQTKKEIKPDPNVKKEQSANVIKKETDDSANKAENIKPDLKNDDSTRVIRGVMRVGILSDNLVLNDDEQVELVVLCSEVPTRQLLNQLYSLFFVHLKSAASEDNYTVNLNVSDACFVVATSGETKLSVTVTLTSPVVREMLMAAEAEAVTQNNVVNPEALDQAKCLEALAQLRRAKWFQARPGNNHSSVMVIKILRDLCLRNPTWSPLALWPVELLVDRVVGIAALTGAEALRKVLEAVAGGILLPGSPGIADPCEKTQVDAANDLTPQQRADITASAEHALRLLAFRQIHKVLGISPIAASTRVNKYGTPRFARKRRRDQSVGDSNENEAGDGKKDKKDGESSSLVVMDTQK